MFSPLPGLVYYYLYMINLGNFKNRVKGQKERFRTFFVPRIGVLNQYPPKELQVPEWYNDNNRTGTCPKISIVTPSFNSNEFLGRTIESVVGQNYPDLEYIVQDGGSTDGTVDILKHYSDQIFHWESSPDQGQSNAINLGFRHATGEIMAYLNSDDVLLPGTLDYVANYFSVNQDVDAVYGHRVLINENDDETGRWVLPRHDKKILACHDFVPQETLFWRRSIWQKAGGSIDEDFNFAMDWDLLLRLQDAGAHFVRLPRFLACFRVHSNMKSIVDWDEVGLVEMDRLRKRCHGPVLPQKKMDRITQRYIWKHYWVNKLYRLGIFKY